MIPFRNRNEFVAWKRSSKKKCVELRIINDIYLKLRTKDDGKYTRDEITLDSLPFIYNFFYNKGFAVTWSTNTKNNTGYIYVSTDDFILKKAIIRRARTGDFIYMSYRRFKSYKLPDKNVFNLILQFLTLEDIIPTY